jgi:hypothetical protein
MSRKHQFIAAVVFRLAVAPEHVEVLCAAATAPDEADD